MLNYYQILDISPNAAEEQIAQRLKDKIRLWYQLQNHQDIQKQHEAANCLNLVPDLKKHLLNKENRAAYNKQLRTAERRPRPDQAKPAPRRVDTNPQLQQEVERLLSQGNIPAALVLMGGYTGNARLQWTEVKGGSTIPAGFYPTDFQQVQLAREYAAKARDLMADSPDMIAMLDAIDARINSNTVRRFHGNWFLAAVYLLLGLWASQTSVYAGVPIIMFGVLFAVSCRTPLFRLNQLAILGGGGTLGGYLRKLGKSAGRLGFHFGNLGRDLADASYAPPYNTYHNAGMQTGHQPLFSAILLFYRITRIAIILNVLAIGVAFLLAALPVVMLMNFYKNYVVAGQPRAGVAAMIGAVAMPIASLAVNPALNTKQDHTATLQQPVPVKSAEAPRSKEHQPPPEQTPATQSLDSTQPTGWSQIPLSRTPQGDNNRRDGNTLAASQLQDTQPPVSKEETPPPVPAETPLGQQPRRPWDSNTIATLQPQDTRPQVSKQVIPPSGPAVRPPPSQPPRSAQIEGVGVSAVDGRSIRITTANGPMVLVLQGVAPLDPQRAMGFLTTLISNQKVFCHQSSRGGHICILSRSQKDIGAELISAGVARPSADAPPRYQKSVRQ